MKKTWKAIKAKWLEIGLVGFVLIVAMIVAVIQPISQNILGYFADVATIGFILVAISLVIAGTRRRVV